MRRGSSYILDNVALVHFNVTLDTPAPDGGAIPITLRNSFLFGGQGTAAVVNTARMLGEAFREAECAAR